MSIEAQSARRIMAVKPNMVDRYVNHVCSHRRCLPENESTLITKGMLSGPALTEHVYVCTMRKMHICTRERCDMYGTTPDGTCPISGVHYANHAFSHYKRSDPRSWRSKPSNISAPAAPEQSQLVGKDTPRINRRNFLSRSDANLFSKEPITQEDENEGEEEEEVVLEKTTTTTTRVVVKNNKKKKRRGTSKRKFVESDYELFDIPEAVLQKARDLVRLLLYSHHRKQINDDVRAKHIRARDKHCQDYIRMCKEQRQRTVLTDFARFNMYFLNLPVPLVELSVDQAKLDNLAYIIIHVWRLVNRYYEQDAHDNVCKIGFESVALGTLYTMRQGYTVRDLEVLPQDAYLAYYLPQMKDLSRFKMDKKCITKGEKLLSETYDKAFSKSATREELLIDVTRLKESGKAGRMKHVKKFKEGRSSVVFLKE